MPLCGGGNLEAPTPGFLVLLRQTRPYPNPQAPRKTGFFQASAVKKNHPSVDTLDSLPAFEPTQRPTISSRSR